MILEYKWIFQIYIFIKLRTSEKRATERRQQYKIVREHVKKEEVGRVHAYGWSVPISVTEKNEFIPVPVFCRPLMDIEPSLKVSVSFYRF